LSVVESYRLRKKSKFIPAISRRVMIGLKCHRGREWSVIELRDGDEVTLFKGTESECRERLAELKKACEK
jgi:hypothetical protein